jgi:hypothetical protein
MIIITMTIRIKIGITITIRMTVTITIAITIARLREMVSLNLRPIIPRKADPSEILAFYVVHGSWFINQ